MVGLLVLSIATLARPQVAADLVFLHGDLLSADTARLRVQTMAIDHGRILAVGSERDQPRGQDGHAGLRRLPLPEPICSRRRSPDPRLISLGFESGS